MSHLEWFPALRRILRSMANHFFQGVAGGDPINEDNTFSLLNIGMQRNNRLWTLYVYGIFIPDIQSINCYHSLSADIFLQEVSCKVPSHISLR